MSVLYKTNVEEAISNKPDSVTAFNLAAAATQSDGLRNVLAAYVDTDKVPCHISDNAGLWEEGIYTVAGTTLVRTSIDDSSNGGSAVDFSAGGALTLIVGNSAKSAVLTQLARSTIRPGGRLTIESGVGVSSTDQLAKTTIYYTPYVHDVIQLWDGVQWLEQTFTEKSITLGTLANTFPHDVFGYIDGSGNFVLELLAWSSDSAQATATVLVDGRYVKSGDKTRLWLGTILPKTTTTIEDSLLFRGLWNVYNKTLRLLDYATGNISSTFTATTSYREYNGDTDVHNIKFVLGLPQEIGTITIAAILSTSISGDGACILIGDNKTTGYSGSQVLSNVTVNNASRTAVDVLQSSAGKHTYTMLQRTISAGDCISNYCRIKARVYL